MLSIWKSDIPNEVNEVMRKKESIRHKRYYEKNRKKILRKQKKNDELRDRKTYSKKHYLAHKDEINKKNKERYQNDKLKRRADAKRYYDLHKEEIAKRRKQLREMKKKEIFNEFC